MIPSPIQGRGVRARAPAKIILSGEHAVVYGQPALAMAINRYTEATVDWSTPFHLTFNLLGIDFKKKMTLEALKRLKRKLRKQYEQFSSGHIGIREVLKHPFELTLYTAMNVIEKLKHQLPMGIDIDSHSSIPIGCGLGSSAACVVSMMTALGRFLDIHMDVQDYLQMGIESENLQHGFSSGLDVHISYHGGCMLYQNGMFTPRAVPLFPFQLVLTGKPASSTGECVSHVRRFFESGTTQRLDDFKAITLSIDDAISVNDMLALKRGISENHRLLQHLGVVPEVAAEFIACIEKQGGAAKICGAGSIYPGGAGVILVVSGHPITELCQQFGYTVFDAQGDARGAHVF